MDEPKPRKRARANGEGSVYPVKRKRRRNGKDVEVTVYEGYVTLDIVGAKQRRKFITAPTKAEATAKIRQLLNSRDEGALTLTSSPSVQDWLEYYLRELAPRKPIKGRVGNRGTTLSSYKGLARNWVNPRIGTVKLERLQVEHLEAVYQAMADAGLASSSIRSCHAMLGTALTTAWKRGRLPRNVTRLAMLPAGKSAPELREVTVEEMQAVLAVANQRRMASRWVTRLAYGIRQGECLGLSWADIDFERQELRITQQLQRARAEHGCGAPTETRTIVGEKRHGCGPASGTETTRPRIRHGCGDPIGETTVDVEGRTMARPRKLYACGKNQPSQCPAVTEEGGGAEVDVYPCGRRQPGRCPKVVAGEVREVHLFPCGNRQPARCPQATGSDGRPFADALVLVPVKTRASQAPLPLPAPIAALLKARKTEQKRERIQEGSRWVGWEVDGRQADLVFTQRNGRPLDCHDDWEEWYELLGEAGVEGIKPHAARHWAATMLVALGVHPRTAMEMLRHADVSTTLNLYAKAPSADLRAAADALAEALLGKAIGE